MERNQLWRHTTALCYDHAVGSRHKLPPNRVLGVVAKRSSETALVEPGARLLHCIAVLDAVDGDGYVAFLKIDFHPKTLGVAFGFSDADGGIARGHGASASINYVIAADSCTVPKAQPFFDVAEAQLL
jgi:hypothetical protein